MAEENSSSSWSTDGKVVSAATETTDCSEEGAATGSPEGGRVEFADELIVIPPKNAAADVFISPFGCIVLQERRVSKLLYEPFFCNKYTT
jgi:hypothetical protein